MILVHYDGRSLLTLEGHAGADKPGQDLVCAAVTALALTLGENSIFTKLQPGFGEFLGGDPAVFRAISKGFARLARDYPAYLCFRQDGENTTNEKGES